MSLTRRHIAQLLALLAVVLVAGVVYAQDYIVNTSNTVISNTVINITGSLIVQNVANVSFINVTAIIGNNATFANVSHLVFKIVLMNVSNGIYAYNVSPLVIANSSVYVLGALINLTRTFLYANYSSIAAPAVLIYSPVPVTPKTEFGELVVKGGLKEWLRELKRRAGILALAMPVITSSELVLNSSVLRTGKLDLVGAIVSALSSRLELGNVTGRLVQVREPIYYPVIVPGLVPGTATSYSYFKLSGFSLLNSTLSAEIVKNIHLLVSLLSNITATALENVTAVIIASSRLSTSEVSAYTLSTVASSLAVSRAVMPVAPTSAYVMGTYSFFLSNISADYVKLNGTSNFLAVTFSNFTVKKIEIETAELPWAGIVPLWALSWAAFLVSPIEHVNTTVLLYNASLVGFFVAPEGGAVTITNSNRTVIVRIGERVYLNVTIAGKSGFVLVLLLEPGEVEGAVVGVNAGIKLRFAKPPKMKMCMLVKRHNTRTWYEKLSEWKKRWSSHINVTVYDKYWEAVFPNETYALHFRIVFGNYSRGVVVKAVDKDIYMLRYRKTISYVARLVVPLLFSILLPSQVGALEINTTALAGNVTVLDADVLPKPGMLANVSVYAPAGEISIVTIENVTATVRRFFVNGTDITWHRPANASLAALLDCVKRYKICWVQNGSTVIIAANHSSTYVYSVYTTAPTFEVQLRNYTVYVKVYNPYDYALPLVIYVKFYRKGSLVHQIRDEVSVPAGAEQVYRYAVPTELRPDKVEVVILDEGGNVLYTWSTSITYPAAFALTLPVIAAIVLAAVAIAGIAAWAIIRKAKARRAQMRTPLFA